MAKLTAEELAALFKEIRADTAAGKRENAHGTPAEKEAFQKILDGKTKAAGLTKTQENGIER